MSKFLWLDHSEKIEIILFFLFILLKIMKENESSTQTNKQKAYFSDKLHAAD